MPLPRLSLPRLPIGEVVARAITAPAVAAAGVVTDPGALGRAVTAPLAVGRELLVQSTDAVSSITEPARAAASLVTHPRHVVDALVRHHERRLVTTTARIHLELRPVDGLAPRERSAVDRRIEARMADIAGVHWAEVHSPSRRLVVAFDPGALIDSTTLEQTVRDALDDVEHELGLRETNFADRDHPADEAPIVRDLVGIGADLVGITLGSYLQAARFRPPPIEIDLAAALNVADQVVPIRRSIERRLGTPLTDLSIGFSNAVVQGIVQGPLGPMVDLGRRVLLFRELTERRSTWLAREPELFAAPAGVPRGSLRGERCVPVPPGPIERYERISWGTSAGAGVLALLVSRRLERAASMVQATLPKAARLGREGYVREFAHHLAARGVVVHDPSALHLLDRVDCVAIDAALLGPAGVDLAGIVAVANRGGLRVFVEVVPGEHVPSGAEGVPLGRLADAVVDAQRAGHVVALAASGRHPASLVADIALGLVAVGEPVPWGAHLIGTDDPADAVLLLEAVLQARQVTSESVKLAMIGAGGAAIVALGSVVPGRYQRAPSVVSIASALSLVNGLRHAYDVARRPLPVRVDPTPWHALDVDTVLDRLGTKRSGLSASASRARQQPEPSPPGLPVAFTRAVADELVNPLTPVLAGGAALSVLVGSVVDAALVTGVVMANAVVGGVQNLRTQRALQALSRTQPTDVTVLRGGRRHAVPPSELVQGDVVRVLAGQAVPADLRIVACTSLEADESSLTGESLPVPKSADPVEAAVLAERSSMLFEGSWVAAGEATGVVVATGTNTEARRAVLLAGEPPTAGVEARLRSWTGRMIPIALLGGGAIVVNGIVRARPVRETLGAGVSLAVAAVPEGLPLLSTVAQLAAARRLSSRNVLVRNARAIEALGRVDVLCADKTGTLTEGRITLRIVSDGVDEGRAGALTDDLREVLAAAVRATPIVEDPSELAHPTDRAVAAGGFANGARYGWQPDGELAFEPGRGYHAATGLVGTRRVLSVKGAPEVILPRCRTWQRAGAQRELTDDDRQLLADHVESLARRGLRVLAVAEGTPNGSGKLDDLHVRDLAFVGLLGLADPARDTASAAVGLLRQAGVRVLMITGDHPSTAEAIGAELGLLDGGEIVTGDAIDATDDEQLPTLLARASVFARVTPAHKVRIVRALQHEGHAVAMTGDGANDAPAIRLADVGIALGSDATPAARNAADIVVLDERIETIVDALVEGRALWGAVRDAVAVLVGGNLGEIIFTVLGSVIVGRPPMNARQLLLVNLLTDAAPALAIAARPPRAVSAEQLLAEGPDVSLASALDRAIAWRAVTTAGAAGAAWALSGPLVSPRRASTVALAATVGTQLGQTVMTSSRDPLVLVAGVGSAALLCAVVQTPGLSQLFGCTPLDPLGWMVAGTAAASGSVSAAVLPHLLERRALPQLPAKV